jgi:hypothetical protein
MESLVDMEKCMKISEWLQTNMSIEYKHATEMYADYRNEMVKHLRQDDEENSDIRYKWVLYLHLKMFAFLCLSALFLALCGLIAYMILIGNALFSALIIWRSLNNIFENSFVKSLESIFSNIAHLLGLSYLGYLTYPFVIVLKAIANIQINFSAVNVTCEGSKAPLQLVVNCLIIGYIVKVIESGFLIYNATLFKATNKVLGLSIFTKYVYSTRGFKSVVALGSLLSGLFSYGSPLQFILRYLIGFLFLKEFTAKYYIFHADSQTCNTIAGAPNIDLFYAVSASLVAWSVLTPVMYQLATVLVPYDG